MLKQHRFFLSLYILSNFLFSQNNHPIVLIHGFLGWGRDEMFQYYYWGGKNDYESMLRDLGYDVYTVSVGPISSNWDRAIEAFYQIKGGQVDYGKERAKKYNIDPRPKNKNYQGLYPNWDHNNPIHIIGHSQGGQTAKMLEVLLKSSFIDENSPLLSYSKKGWIKSITTISTPHNGSTLVPIMMDVFPFALHLAPWFGSINNKSIDKLYNFDLEHWGLKRNTNETFNNFFSRISNSTLIDSKALCSWDLSPEGSEEFNNSYENDRDVYYFSFSTYTTIKKTDSYFHKPTSELSYHLWPTAMLMGNDSNAPDKSWYENDGICNTGSMQHPGGQALIQYNGNPKTGVWQHIKKLHIDHQAIIGHGASDDEHKNIFALYNDHCRLLYTLK
jgi:triacylglycerol lipase